MLGPQHGIPRTCQIRVGTPAPSPQLHVHAHRTMPKDSFGLPKFFFYDLKDVLLILFQIYSDIIDILCTSKLKVYNVLLSKNLDNERDSLARK